MAIARDTVAKHIKPLTGAIRRVYTAGAAIEAGEVVSIMGDGFVDPAIGTSVAGARAVGIALNAAVAAGEPVTAVVFGPVQCVTGGTPGALAYVSDTAGEPAETAGTKSTIVGFVEAATIIFVNVDYVALV